MTAIHVTSMDVAPPAALNKVFVVMALSSAHSVSSVNRLHMILHCHMAAAQIADFSLLSAAMARKTLAKPVIAEHKTPIALMLPADLIAAFLAVETSS